MTAKSTSQTQVLSQSMRTLAMESKLKSIAVADFVTKGGAASPEGLYFSDLIQLYLDEPPKKWTMVNRDAVSRFLGVHKMRPGAVGSPEVIRQVGEALRADSILTGTVDAGPENLVLELSLVRTSDAGVIGTANALIREDAFYRSLLTYPAPPKVSGVASVSGKGVHSAEPLDFPAVQFRGPADANRAQPGRETVVLLRITISAEGRVAGIQVAKGEGTEFAEIAWRSGRAWRFKPAVDRTGAPVATQILLEVVFRLD